MQFEIDNMVETVIFVVPEGFWNAMPAAHQSGTGPFHLIGSVLPGKKVHFTYKHMLIKVVIYDIVWNVSDFQNFDTVISHSFLSFQKGLTG